MLVGGHALRKQINALVLNLSLWHAWRTCYRFHVLEQELLSFDVLEHVLTAGGVGELHFWDRRMHTVAAKLEDTHMDEVTQVGWVSHTTTFPIPEEFRCMRVCIQSVHHSLLHTCMHRQSSTR